MTPAELQQGAALLAAIEQEHLKAEGRMVVDANGNVLAMMNLAMHPKLAEANAAAIAWLRTHAADLIADAERYAWLRDGRQSPETWNRLAHYAEHELDQRIDAARKGTP
jgi:hypothetical protein